MPPSSLEAPVAPRGAACGAPETPGGPPSAPEKGAPQGTLATAVLWPEEAAADDSLCLLDLQVRLRIQGTHTSPCWCCIAADGCYQQRRPLMTVCFVLLHPTLR